MHFAVQRPDRYNGFDHEYYAQFEAEKKVRRRKPGSRETVVEYVKIRERNEAIDLEVGCLAALHLLGAGERMQLGELARMISEAGPKWKEAFEARGRRGRRVISRGIA